MKAISTIIIAAVLTLSVNVLFASNDNVSAPVANANTTIAMTSLAPAVPAEADFEDAVEMIDFSVLAPVTPVEAQFEDISYESVAALNLAPLTPAVADVNEEIDYGYLAPAVPPEADFE